MALLNRLIPRIVTAARIEQVSQRLPPAAAAPSRKDLRCVCESFSPPAMDWMDWSLWQDKRDNQVWAHCSGGVASIDMWYGPGEPSVAGELIAS